MQEHGHTTTTYTTHKFASNRTTKVDEHDRRTKLSVLSCKE